MDIKLLTTGQGKLGKTRHKLLLVSAPNPLYWNTAKHNAIQAWCDQNQVTYVDYNLKLDELNMNWQEDYRDGGDHLNSNGAKKFIKDFRPIPTRELQSQ